MLRNGSQSGATTRKIVKKMKIEWSDTKNSEWMRKRVNVYTKKWCRLTYFYFYSIHIPTKSERKKIHSCHHVSRSGKSAFRQRAFLTPSEFAKKMRKSSSTWVAIYLPFTYLHSLIPTDIVCSPPSTYLCLSSCSSACLAVAFTAKWQWKVNVHYVDYFFILNEK